MKKEVDFYVRSDANRALDFANQAYEIALSSDDPLARALAFRAKAQALHVAGRYPEALPLYRQAKAVYENENLVLESARVARAMADALMYLGLYEEALALAEEARTSFLQANEPLMAAQAETNLGNIFHRLDRYRDALAYYRSAMQVFSDAGEPTSLAVVLFNTANIEANLDDFRQAGEHYQAAHDIYASQGMLLAAAQSKYSLGYLHFLKGAYHPAMRTLHEVLGEFRRLGDNRFVMLCGLDLAEIYLQLNLLQEAAGLAEEAHRAAEGLQLRYESAKALSYLGLAYMHQSKLDKAERALLRAETMFREEANEIYQAMAGLYLAELAIRRRRPAEALRLCEQAEAVFERHGLNVRTCYARLILASAAALCGDLARSRSLCESLLETASAVYAPWFECQVNELLGDLSSAADPARAEHYYRRAADCIERIRNGIRVDEFRSAFLGNKLPVYDKLIQLCLARPDRPEPDDAFFYLESQKVRTLVDLLASEAISDSAATPEIGDLQDRRRRLREELHWLQAKASRAETSGIRRASAGGAATRDELYSRERELQEVSRRIQLLDPGFVSLQGAPGLTIEQLREALRDDEVVVEYYFQKEELKLFVIDRIDLQVVASPVARSEINAIILELKFYLDKLNYGDRHAARHGEQILKGANDCLRRLYRALVEPAVPFIGGRSIIFVPFDTLHSIPFPALFDGAEYLADRHEIAIAPSARVLVACSQRRAGGYSRALILGSADSIAPQITEEVHAIRRRFPSAVCLTGAGATGSALAAHAPAADVIHIASHGVFRHDSPMFSSLRLADEWVNCYDIASLRLSSALVTLSGCRTGVLGVHAGDELSGLTRSFLSAGAGALVVSLWSVDDTSTAKMMDAFYFHLQSGLSPRAALRAASLSIKRENPNPWFWAPFVCVGGH